MGRQENTQEFSKIKFFLFNTNKTVVLLSRSSPEGIAATAIFVKTLKNINKNFSVSFYTSLDESKLQEISIAKTKTMIILDPLEQEVRAIQTLKEKYFFVLTSKETTCSEKAYTIAKEIDPKNQELAFIMLLSLINFENETVLTEVKKSEKLEEIKGFLLFGSNTRPVHKTLELSFNPFLSKYSGSEENSSNLLKELGIISKVSNSSISLFDLQEYQTKQLIEALNLSSLKEEELYAKTFLIKEEEKTNPLKDIREVHIFIEACIAYEKPTLAVAKIFSTKEYKNRALEVLKEYRLELINALTLFYTKTNLEIITEKENCSIINFKTLISEAVLPKVMQLIQSSKLYPQKKRVIALCQTKTGQIKCGVGCYGEKTDQTLKTFIEALPEQVIKETTKDYLMLNVDHSYEAKLLEIVLEHFEAVRIEGVSE